MRNPHRGPLFVFACIAFCSIASHGSLHADMIRTTDGSTLLGTVAKLVDGKIYLETRFAGSIAIPIDQVVEMQTDAPMPIHLDDGSVIQGTIQVTQPETMEIERAEDQTTFPVVPGRITAINPPPPELPKWKGKVVGSLSVTSGNSDTMGVGLTAEAVRRAEADRITLRGGYFYQKDGSRSTRDDQYIAGKYDYYFTDKLFGYLNTRLDRDAIKELELRSTGGAGLGYQFLENDIHTLFTEAGLSYVSEDYRNNDDDQTYAAGRFAGNFTWWIVKEKLLFTQGVEVLLSVEDVEDFIGISETGLNWYLTNRWYFNAGIRYEYDNTPAEGQERTDTKYLVGLGYEF